MSEKLVRITGSWWVCVAVVALWTIAVQNFQWKLLYFTGDEPHYMISVLSFVLDGDFNNKNNYQQGDYKRFGYEKLGPQFEAYGYARPDVIPAEHGTAFPLLIAPAYLIYGIDGVRIFLLILSTGACLLLAGAVRLLTGSAAAGTLGGILLAISPTWQMQSSRIYPESVAGVFTIVVLFVLARQAAAPGRALDSYSLFAAGFFTAATPLMYTKYIGLSLGLAVAILLLPAIRKRPAVWLGIAFAVLLGLANAVIWGEQGAMGNAAIHRPHNFAVEGWIARYWRPLFDRHHGIVPFQPYIFLFLWPMLQYLQPWQGRHSEKRIVLAGAAIGVLLYTLIHGIWTGSPGYSVPGRYLSAALPLMVLLIAVWATTKDRWRPLRLALIAAGSLVAVAFYVVAMEKHTPPYYVLWNYTYLFPRYWDSWDAVSKVEMRPVAVLDYGVPLLLIAVTKAAARFLRRQDAVPSE